VPGQQPTIQAGIDAASVGDTVLVAPGTYTGAGNRDIDFGGQIVTVLSEAGPTATFIDCEGAGRGVHFHSDEGAFSIFAGFTIRNGVVAGNGGGILIHDCSPTIRECVLTGNTAAELGGGIAIISTEYNYPDYVRPFITDCVVTENTALGGPSAGGGIAAWEYAFPGEVKPTVERCTISANTNGGLLADTTYPQALFRDCEITENSGWGVTMTGSFGGANFEGCLISANTDGGVLFTQDPVAAVFTDCTIAGHTTSESGAGVRDYSYEGQLQFIGCRFLDNHTSASGGGLYIGGDADGGALFENCEFDGNSAASGGALAYYQNMGNHPCTISDCAFSHNTATGDGGAVKIITTFIPATISGSSFWENSAGARGGALYCGIDFEDLVIRSCTLASNEAPVGPALHLEPYDCFVTLEQTIVAFSQGGDPMDCGSVATIANVSCCDLHGNQGGDWVGCMAPWAGLSSNVSADPQFCELTAGDLTIAETSPCAPAHSGGCGLIGAWPVGCGTVAVPELESPGVAVSLRIAPNPVLHAATFTFDGSAQRLALEIYDPAGRLVEKLAPTGAVTWTPGDRAARGVYFARLRGDGVSETVKFVVLR
jgi:hypothetical protein